MPIVDCLRDWFPIAFVWTVAGPLAGLLAVKADRTRDLRRKPIKRSGRHRRGSSKLWWGSERMGTTGSIDHIGFVVSGGYKCCLGYPRFLLRLTL